MKIQMVEVWRGTIDEILQKIDDEYKSAVGHGMAKDGSKLTSINGIEQQLQTIKLNCKEAGIRLMVGSFFYLKPTLKIIDDVHAIPEISLDLANQFVIIEEYLETESL